MWLSTQTQESDRYRPDSRLTVAGEDGIPAGERAPMSLGDCFLPAAARPYCFGRAKISALHSQLNAIEP
jgi:hypothetical protein